MPLLDQIQKDMVAAMKAKDEARLSAIRMVKSALQKFQIDSMKPLFLAVQAVPGERRQFQHCD